MKYNFDNLFPRYEDYNPLVPVWCVTPEIDRAIHRFYNSSPFSPSGRYLVLTCLPFEDRRPEPGEIATIILVDLVTGKTTSVACTRGWDTQLGAQTQWGADDSQLFFNDVDTTTWMPYGIRMNPLTGEKQRLDGTIYSVSPNGKWSVSTCLRRMITTQAGYGVIIPHEYMPSNQGAVDDDGVYITDTETGKTTLIASYKRIVGEAVPAIDMSRYGVGDYYGFHVSWNSKNDRIMLVLRYRLKKNGRSKPQLITMKPDGSDIRVAIPACLWADNGGNHPGWCPDGEHLMMNLNITKRYWRFIRKQNLRFVQCRYDGTDLRFMTEVSANRGHPTLHPSARYILTDAYPTEKAAFGDITAPLWLIDLATNEKKTLVRIESVSRFFKEGLGKQAKSLRVDLHPAFDSRTYSYVAFNGVGDGTRRVFIADLTQLISN